MEACPKKLKILRENRVELVPGVTQAMAGYMLSMHPVTVNRILATLRDRGILGRFTKNRLDILDLHTLREIAAGAPPDHSQRPES